MRRMEWRFCGALLLAAAVAACGSNVENEMGENAALEATRPLPVSEAQAAALEGELVTASLSEWQIRLSPDTMDAGDITFRARNSGQVAHALEVESAEGEEWEVDEIGPGEEKTLTVRLAAGTYSVYCPVQGEHGKHGELGMRTTLVVR